MLGVGRWYGGAALLESLRCSRTLWTTALPLSTETRPLWDHHEVGFRLFHKGSEDSPQKTTDSRILVKFQDGLKASV